MDDTPEPDPGLFEGEAHARHERWSRARKILCVRLDSIGDVLMTTPAIRALRESGPGRHITLLTSPSGAAVAALVPEVDDAIVYDAPWMKATAPRRSSQPDEAMLACLRQANFDAAVIFTVYSQNPLPAALFCYLSGIPLRLAHCHENPYQLLTDWIPDPEPEQGIRHEVQRQLDLVAAVGSSTRDERLSLRCSPGAVERVRRRLREHGLDLSQPWVVLHPGATAGSRRYPPEHYAEVGRRLVRDEGVQIVLAGAEAERELVGRIQSMIDAPACSLAGLLDLEELAALLSLSPLLIANNSGPAHMAAAMGSPVVVLYALTNPQHKPWGVPTRVLFHDVPCKYCYRSICPEGHHHCLRLVEPEAVVKAALDLLVQDQDGRPQEQGPFHGSGALVGVGQPLPG